MDILRDLATSGPVSWQAAITSVLLAFGLGQAIALTYILAFKGLSYSRNFVQSMAFGPIITCMLMLAIGESIAAGIGIAGGLSIVRFRTTMRDPRDMVFVFAALGAGIVCGLQAYPAALTGIGLFVGAVAVLHLMSYGSRRQFDGLVRFIAPNGSQSVDAISKTMKSHARSFVLVTMREAAQADAMEHAYQVSLPNPKKRNELVHSLQAIPGIQDVTLHMQEPTLEL
jgi:uncharacterized membrane protein YhiD involved in acid resistance